MTTPTMKMRPTPRAEDTRRKIYEAAMAMFREKGFEQTTMRDIAAKAGVALGGAYYYFSSKEAIVLTSTGDAGEQPRIHCDSHGGHKKLKTASAASWKALRTPGAQPQVLRCALPPCSGQQGPALTFQ